MTLSSLAPDEALAATLDLKIEVQTSATNSNAIKAYANASRPNASLGDEFIELFYNGIVQSVTRPREMFKGNLALTIYCKANSDGTAKHKRIASIMEQVEQLISGKTSESGGTSESGVASRGGASRGSALSGGVIGDYFFDYPANNIITPTTVNPTTGYSVTTINIEWRTRHGAALAAVFPQSASATPQTSATTTSSVKTTAKTK